MADSPDKSKKSTHAEREERILKFWKDKDIFKKSLDKEAPKGEFTFYDGPPFATGLPHYGHILPGTIKDVVPRFKTMQGYRVRRRWGWDCHGLPVENLIEKELGLKSKKDILAYGIGKFNEAARRSVMRHADEWRAIVPRLGRWVDMDDDYRTMDASYTESVWWIFKRLHDKGLIYEGFKSMNLCPHCETTLSNFEVAQGYKDITDISVYAKFELADEPGTFLLAWTTTPWTLPGNTALAVSPHTEYCRVRADGGIFIAAKERLEAVFKDKQHEIVGMLRGSELVGRSYKPIFGYYSDDRSLKNCENGWKVYPADFVTTTDGTGIVHIAPAFGADDYELMKKHDLPFVQHVSVDGTFKPEVKDFAGMKVKPIDTEEDKDAHQKADIEILKWLAHHGLLFEKEKLVHSYPHCWRCQTPLLNYASSSWFVRVTSLKDELVRANRKIKWVPPSVGENRFGDWLLGARDWAISRSRFWGAPIPVWREEKTGAVHVIGSVDDLKKFSRAKNAYYVMRHGEAGNNAKEVLNYVQKDLYPLTEKGREQVRISSKNLKGAKIDFIYCSPFIRARETAELVAEMIGLKKEDIKIENRLHEFNMGKLDGEPISRLTTEFPDNVRFDKWPEGGEGYVAIKKRMGDILYELESKYAGKTILLVTHETPAFLLISVTKGLNHRETLAMRPQHRVFGNAEVRKLDFSPLPHNAEYELDLHRPFIDDLELKTPSGDRLIRVPDVLDCWFESGSMPYGEAHYPFERMSGFDPSPGWFKRSRGYPADFIAEGLDQTRGWFYSMLVLGVALFGKSPYENVVVNGLVLAENGQKMSKSKNNFPDPMLLVERYGADALRHYLVSSQAVRAEELRFSERGVDEVVKKIINRLLNVVSFYEMYAPRAEEATVPSFVSSNVLDHWIISRLNELIVAVTSGLEAYELDRAARPVEDFVDDLSTWYLRRSRERFKGDGKTDKQTALTTTRFVLVELAKIIAPFMPFLAEDVYRRAGGLKESVHLENWPTVGKIDEKILKDMETVRTVASKGLEARMAFKINVRQPLSTLASGTVINPDLVGILKDEINVKEFKFVANLEKDELNTTITPALKEEGDLRELLRKIQDMRKEKGLSVNDSATLTATDDLKDLISRHEKEIKASTHLTEIRFGDLFELKA